MTLRTDAVSAFQASQSGREGAARAVMASTLTPEDVSGLTVADVTVATGYTTFVFTDGDVHLAVVLRGSGNEVDLVTGSIGNWTNLATITSLADLGMVLPGLVPPPAPPSGPAAWAPAVAYKVGDKVSYGGKTYTCVQAHTSQADWTPSAVPALWSSP